MQEYYKDKYVTIYHGDCRDILPSLEPVDLVLTSPPYDDLRDYGGYTFDFPLVAKELHRVVSDGGIIVWVVGDSCNNGSESGSSFKQALGFMECGFKLHDTMIYLKNSSPFPDSNRYTQIFEYMFVLSKNKPKCFNPIKRKNNYGSFTRKMTHRKKDGSMNLNETVTLSSDSNYGNVWLYEVGFMKSSNNVSVFEHPAIFPEALASDHILSWSNTNDLILDPFLGSGTTAYCAKKLQRRCIGIEIEEKYCEIAARRCQQEVMELNIEDKPSEKQQELIL
jgi:DNA modification methylase